MPRTSYPGTGTSYIIIKYSHSNFPYLRRTTAIYNIHPNNWTSTNLHVPRVKPSIRSNIPKPNSPLFWNMKKVTASVLPICAQKLDSSVYDTDRSSKFYVTSRGFHDNHLRHSHFGIWVHLNAFLLFDVCVMCLCVCVLNMCVISQSKKWYLAACVLPWYRAKKQIKTSDLEYIKLLEYTSPKGRTACTVSQKHVHGLPVRLS